jgi:hypothetical protein
MLSIGDARSRTVHPEELENLLRGQI